VRQGTAAFPAGLQNAGIETGDPAMSATIQDFLASPPRRSLLRRLRWWLLQRRSQAILRSLQPRLRVDIGLPEGTAGRAGMRLPTSLDCGLSWPPR
jgi:hypothetical protein